jgi:hypothetical protein
MGVPIVNAAGNTAIEGPFISNAIPQVLQDDDNPLIVVGATEYDGKRWFRSQIGRINTLFASGVSVDCQTKFNKMHALKTGTSYGMV